MSLMFLKLVRARRLMRNLVGGFVRSLVGGLVRSFMRSLVGLVRELVRSFVRSLVEGLVGRLMGTGKLGLRSFFFKDTILLECL